MPDSLVLLLYRYPAFCRSLGTAVYQAACLVLLAGVFVQIIKVAASATTGFAGQPPVTDIAMLLPGVWTWWVPETFTGVALYAVLAVAGAALSIASKTAQRHLRYV
ncbi:MAG: hypothetical protein Q7T63_14955 [Burkholderiaceae bacterium]|nr:hypothetical protein [Burkholderiaceae bacterium]MDP3136627.1 hypothetical protein [Burkholderiaceae bacterium]